MYWVFVIGKRFDGSAVEIRVTTDNNPVVGDQFTALRAAKAVPRHEAVAAANTISILMGVPVI